MLYVFLVDTGTMIQLDMNLALEKVNYLKGVIARSCRIPPDKQVLLISGGESLDAEERVCKYAAGTDTNPIFLFSLISIESSMPPEIHPEIASEFSESELNEKVNSSLKLEDAQSTVAIRATLAQEYVKASSEQTRMCEMLIHDQHLQHQGWSAVVANLEDLATDLKKHSERLEVTFHEYLEKRENHLEVIDTFDNDLAVLHRIPVFPALLNPDVNPEMSMVSSISFSSVSNESVSLLEWINSRGSSQSLELVAESCYKSLQQLDHELLDDLRTKVNNAVEGAQNSQMKEVRGLGDRLSGLEQLLLEAKRIVTEQQELAAAFLQNQQRAYGLKDASILPDLCASHRQQLLVMKKNHQSIMSICSRTAKAKNELSANLHHRMKWVVFIQNQMSEVGQLLVMHVEELKRLRRKLDVVEQIHMAPSIYMATAVEVVRRRAFADHYLYKANSLADTFSSLHDEELVLRINFQSKLKKHFLSKMFPGMEDQPPSFATSKPVVFDNQLPEITLADVELLRNQFPDLAKSLSLPEENALSNLLAKSFNQTLTQEEGETLYSLQNMPRKISMTTRDIGSMSVMNQLISGMRKQSSRMSAVSDSDDETDNERMLNRDRTRRYSNGKKKKITSGDKLTRSLPHESVTSLTRNNGSTGFNLDLVDPSSSSADPSSSSAGNTTGNNSVAPSSSSDGSVMKQQTPSTSLMQESSTMGKLAEERAALIASLNIKVAESEAKLDKLQTSVRTSLEPCHMSLSALKKDLANMKSKLVADQDSFQKFTDDLKLQIVANVVRVNENSNKRLSLVMEDVEQRARKQSESDLDKIRDKLELEMQKLEDSHREIDIYQQQLQQAAQEADKLKTENIEAKELHSSNMSRLKEATDIEKAEIIKKLTLEHEIELDALREELENSEKVANCEAEVKRLREVLQLKESDVEALRRKTRLLEMTQEEKFHEEKEKIVQILEAGFVQREKLALQQYEDELTSKFQSQLADSRSHWELEQSKVIEALKEDQQANYSKQLSELDKLQKNNIEQMAHKASEELRQKFDEDREAAMKQQHHQLTLKAKRELDALRYRFKMMQTTGAFEQRSPSASESELSLENQNSSHKRRAGAIKSPFKSPRQDVIDNIRSALKLEFENTLSAEQAKWENQMQELKEEHEQTLVEMMSREKIRDIAEQQVTFNEALNKAMEEKNKQLQDLLSEKNTLEDEVSGLKNTRPEDVDLVQQLSEMSQRNTRLETELKDAKFKLEQTMASSVMSLARPDQDPDLQRLQKENAHLKEQLTKSMMSLVSSGKVTVASVDRGDTVMLVWNEDHNNFSVYTEPSGNLPLHFLHNESIQILGLTVPPNNLAKRYCTAEVVDKEYCQAKKSENRFKVPQGTKFYRVRCKSASCPMTKSVSNGNEN